MTALRSRRLAVGAACAAALAVALLPIFAGAAVRDVAFTFLSFVVLAQAWNLIGGFGGQFSLGNSAFVGFGAYVTAWLLVNFALAPLAAIAIAAVTVVPLALLLSFALFRLHGAYLSVGSLAVSLAVIAWMENWSVTGATQGLNIPFDRSVGDHTVYVLTVALAVAVTLAARYLSRSDFGLCLQAVRDDEEAAESVGVAAFATKAIAFALSAAFTSAMGALIALRQISIAGTMVAFDMMELLNGGRSIVGIIEGDSNPPLFIPQLLEHNAQGRFPFEKLISYYPFANLADALHDAESGRAVKPVLTFSEP